MPNHLNQDWYLLGRVYVGDQEGPIYGLSKTEQPDDVVAYFPSFLVDSLQRERASLRKNVARLLKQKRRVAELEAELAQLQNEHIQLRRKLLDYVLDSQLEQDIKPPGDWGDYPFSEN